MLWPFNHFSKSRAPLRRTIEAIYGMIVTRAREPSFYRHIGVPDTVNGRFDLLVLHLWVVLRRLRSVEGGKTLSQGLFDRFCEDMDANLREMGVGDLAVPKRMQAFGEAFYGRAAAYDTAFTSSDEALAQSLNRNVLGAEGLENVRRLSNYVRRTCARLDELDDTTLVAVRWTFPAVATLPAEGQSA
jgi:cytochrome b pre-mRNA-processing protein 3